MADPNKRPSRDRKRKLDPDFDYEQDQEEDLVSGPPTLEDDVGDDISLQSVGSISDTSTEASIEKDVQEHTTGSDRARKRGRGRRQHTTDTQEQETEGLPGTSRQDITGQAGTGAERVRSRNRGRGRGRGKKAKTGEQQESGAHRGERGRRATSSRHHSHVRRGRREGRGRRAYVELDEDQVQRLINFQRETEQQLEVLLTRASEDTLRQLLRKLATQQPGLLFDLVEELNEQEQAPVPQPQQVSPPRSPSGSPTGSPTGSPPESPPGSPPGNPPGSPPGNPPGSPPGSPPGNPPGSPPPDPPAPQGPPQPDWRVCNNCRQMPDPVEDICCRQDPALCIGTSPAMRALILQSGILMLQRLYRADIFAIRRAVDQRGRLRNVAEDNRGFRHATYTQFILWQHGRLGYRNRRVVPSCCALKIRDRFPDPNNQYVGFRPAPLL